jgi:RHH-type transcriptional regulator, rel operon repressor / antitoxin RelB
MLTIELPQGIEDRLEQLARRTGRTKAFYVRQAILAYLEELDDIDLAETTLEDIRAGRTKTIPLETILKKHGLED